MSSYLTTATASTTYQTQAGMTSYQTKSVNTSLITSSTSIASPYYDYYCILTPNATAITITLPTASATLLGTKIMFRRVNTNLAQINCTSITGINNASTTILLSTTQYQCEIVCLINSATPTYAWFIIRQN